VGGSCGCHRRVSFGGSRRRFSLAEDGRGGFLPGGIGYIDEGRVAVTPLEGVLEPADLPAAGGAAERVLVPAVLGVVVVAELVRHPVPGDVVEDAIGLVAVDRDVEVGVLVHHRQAFQAGAGEAGPYLRRGDGGRPPGQVEEVHLERVCQGGRVHVPVVQVQAAAEAQHNVTDLLPVPQLAHHLIDGLTCWRSHRGTALWLDEDMGQAGETRGQRHVRVQPVFVEVGSGHPSPRLQRHDQGQAVRDRGRTVIARHQVLQSPMTRERSKLYAVITVCSLIVIGNGRSSDFRAIDARRFWTATMPQRILRIPNQAARPDSPGGPRTAHRLISTRCDAYGTHCSELPGEPDGFRQA
jgi:hypothetical protein